MKAKTLSDHKFSGANNSVWQGFHERLRPLIYNYDDALATLQRSLGITRSNVTHSNHYTHPDASYSLLHIILCLASELGNEPFYALWAVSVTLYLDAQVSIPLLILWSMGMYVGQYLKDQLHLPRPGLNATSKVARLETTYAAEYGFPSTHALGSFSIPILTLYFFFTHYNIMSYPVYICLVSFHMFWLVCTPLSRLYLGVHSFLDILGGSCIGIIITLMLMYSHVFSTAYLYTYLGSIGFIILTIFMVYIYPQPNRWSNSPGDTALILGTAAGAIFGLTCAKSTEYVPFFQIAIPSTWYTCCTALVRLLVTIITVYIIRLANRKNVYSLTRVLLGAKAVPEKCTMDKPSTLQKWTHDLSLPHVYIVECVEKYVGFFMMGLIACYILPMFWDAIGIYIEVPQIN